MEKALFWHRRDLRIDDNAGLHKALKSYKVIPVFVFDTTILKQLPKDDQRVLFIHGVIADLQEAYRKHGSDLEIVHGDPVEEIPRLAAKFNVEAVFLNRDYEPVAIMRDETVFNSLKEAGIALIGTKDQVIFEKHEVVKDDGKPYSVFTPFSKKWKSTLTDFYLRSYPTSGYLHNLYQFTTGEIPLLKNLGFEEKQTVEFPSEKFPHGIISDYDKTRDIPSIHGTSRLGVHLRFGTISIRKLVREAMDKNGVYLNELIWREFYQMILYHFPHSAKDAFRTQYDNIRWEYDEAQFDRWRNGKTGYPLVDAGMRELAQTGFMHNRVRMVTASFLSKHLLIDWRWGEAWFALKLLDYDAASNVGGWQWAAGCGCDAAPYFRVFNPEAQQQKFDPKMEYIKKWVPEFGTDNYPEPMVEHKWARERAIQRYKEGLS